ncbi:PAS domain S-box-containing protein [Granulicella pectinivorans]|uniref:PAS domain S-box-containing protein n=1 Tax=Granulicella pectinivorans TaxID=474950 RepID=A0A1I6MYL4_9BACT|nr:EAL domain-containing protein [Granulicella pectinivorans]SFS20737.1 PAS domain S-box-containing protein [Granulicella pectinivorans]
MSVQVSDVRTALQNNQIVPNFQPIVSLHTGALVGFEVLARWQHPEIGAVLPENFIAIAEAYGLIGDLTDQVSSKAFHCAPDLPAPLFLAVNLSPAQLQDPNVPSHIANLATSASFPMDRVYIEITESALLDDLDSAKAMARRLKDLGCRLALDDFGTGYSSLAHLQALPFDELKIDRSFVSKMTTTRESRKIVAAIVGLGHSLGLITVGEGIETEEQADMLLSLGCELGQGYLYGKPAPAAQIPTMMSTSHISSSVDATVKSWNISSLEALPTQRLAQLEAIYDGAPVGLCFLDCNMRFVSVNARLAAFSGQGVTTYLGKTIQQSNPERFGSFEPYLRRALDGEALSGVEIALPSSGPDQLDSMLLCSFQPAWDEGGEVIGASVAVVDVTEHKRSEEALVERDDHDKHLEALNNQISWTMDAAGDSLQVSTRWVRANPTHKEPTTYLAWLEDVHAEDIGPALRVLRTALVSGVPIDIRYRVKQASGGWRWMRAKGSPSLDKDGAIVRWYGTVEDIDIREQATQNEAELSIGSGIAAHR